MKNAELVQLLLSLPQDADVVFYSSFTGLSIIPVQKDDVYLETDNTVIITVPGDFFNDIEHQ